MLELVTTIALALSCGTRVPNTIPSSNSEFLHTRSISSPGDYQETTSFGNAETLSFNDPNRMAKFERRNDVDYYKYQITTSGYYKFGVSCTKSVHTMVYTKSNSDLSPQLYTEFTENYGDDNFGFDNGIYIDSTQTQWVYFKINPINGTNSLFYIPIIKNFTPRNYHDDSEFIRYDVSTKLFHYKTLNFSDYTNSLTGNFPNGYAGLDIPSSNVVTNFQLNDPSYFNSATSFPNNLIARNYLNSSVSTGFLVGQNVYITAAHCVAIDDTMKSNLDLATISFGKQFSNESFTSSYSNIYLNKKALFFNNSVYNNVSFSHYDIAICIINDNSDYYFPIDKSKSFSYGNLFSIIGYHSGYEYQTVTYGTNLTFNTDNIMSYLAPTAGGNSGSPVIDYSNNTVIGVHTASGQGVSFSNESFYLINYLRGGFLL